MVGPYDTADEVNVQERIKVGAAGMWDVASQ
jgi:hypothetical protein